MVYCHGVIGKMSGHEDVSEKFELKLVGAGIEITRKIDHQTAAEVMALVLGARPVASANEKTPAQAETEISQPQVSLREFLDEVNARRKPDQIVAIGHYLSTYGSQPTFSRDDVKMRFSAAKEPMPKNFPRDFGLAIKAGMIAPAHQQAGYFYVTKSGIQSVERRFSSESRRQH
jgi:hypothetical protein